MAISEVTQRDTQLEKQRAGFMALTLTEFDTDLEPAIAAGSVVELSGSLYSVTSAESITGSATAGANYIYFDSLGTSFAYSTTAPTWSDAKQGWYNGSNDRAVAGFTFSSPDYSDKYLYLHKDSPSLRADNNFSGDNTFTGTGNNIIRNDYMGDRTFTAQAITSTDYVIPEGVYFIRISSSDTGVIGALEIYADSDWRLVGTSKYDGGSFGPDMSTMIVSDGTNVRVTRLSGTASVSLVMVKLFS